MDRHVAGQIIMGVENLSTFGAGKSLVGFNGRFLRFTQTVILTLFVVFP